MLTFLYRLYDTNDVLLYIGITRHPNARFERHAAERPWWGEVARHSIEEVDTATAARIERAAIKAERPRCNVVHARPERDCLDKAFHRLPGRLRRRHPRKPPDASARTTPTSGRTSSNVSSPSVAVPFLPVVDDSSTDVDDGQERSLP